MLALGLAALVALGFLASRPLALGAAMGFVLGAALALGGAMWVGRVMTTRPSAVLMAQVQVFGIKLACLLGCALVVRIAPSLVAGVDWRAALIGFATAVASLSPLACGDALRVDRRPQWAQAS